MPNLTALLAMLLAERDVPVLVHGPVARPEARHDRGDLPRPRPDLRQRAATRSTTPGSAREPAFIGTGALCPPLARLLEVREVVGLRNSGHTDRQAARRLQRRAGRCASSTTPIRNTATLLAEFIAATRGRRAC